MLCAIPRRSNPLASSYAYSTHRDKQRKRLDYCFARVFFILEEMETLSLQIWVSTCNRVVEWLESFSARALLMKLSTQSLWNLHGGALESLKSSLSVMAHLGDSCVFVWLTVAFIGPPALLLHLTLIALQHHGIVRELCILLSQCV